MIPIEGERHDLNQHAKLSVELSPAEGDSTVPTIVVGGVRVSVYVQSDGVFRVSIATDEGDIDPLIMRGRDDPNEIAMEIGVNDDRIHWA